MKGVLLSMKKIVCIDLAVLMALACTAMAEGTNLSITTGLPTDTAPTTMVVQLDNEPGARPQKGIGSADIVYEIELYNGGYTRYTAVFNDNIPELIEAIRSARIVNADIYTEYGGAFVHFGGQKYEGSSVYDYFGSIKIGKRCNIQDCAVIHNLCTLGDDVSVGHGAIVHGATVGDRVIVGMGAIVLDGAKIGDDCIIAAGAVVTGKMDAPAGSLLVGSPAVVAKPLNDKQKASCLENSELYYRKSVEYRAFLAQQGK